LRKPPFCYIISLKENFFIHKLWRKFVFQDRRCIAMDKSEENIEQKAEEILRLEKVAGNKP